MCLLRHSVHLRFEDASERRWCRKGGLVNRGKQPPARADSFRHVTLLKKFQNELDKKRVAARSLVDELCKLLGGGDAVRTSREDLGDGLLGQRSEFDLLTIFPHSKIVRHLPQRVT